MRCDECIQSSRRKTKIIREIQAKFRFCEGAYGIDTKTSYG